ncbi:hypothetical protein JCM10207_001697 [Rhodosporidiobolus poonsookiae]
MGRNRTSGSTRHHCPHPGCEKSFTRQDHLRRHTANHDATRVRNCPECGRGFARVDVLAAHLKKHENQVAEATVQRSASPPEPGTHPAAATGVDSALPDLFALPEVSSVGELAFQPTPFPDDLDALYAFLMTDASAAELPPVVSDDWLLPDPGFQPDFEALLAPQASSSAAAVPSFAVDEMLRLTLMNYLSVIPTVASSPLLHCPALSSALQRYWSTFHPQLPILHVPTYNPNASTGLFAALVAVGLCIDGDAQLYDLGAAIFRKLRPLILLHEASDMPVSLEAFQALAIIGQANQMLLDVPQHELSYPFNAFEVTLGRSMDIFSWRFYRRHPSSTTSSSEDQWRVWVANESWSRLAYSVITRDIQLSSLFGQLPTRALSALLIRLSLPSSETLWSASSAASWSYQSRPQPQPFPSAVKESLSSASSPSTSAAPLSSSSRPSSPHLNPFSRLIVLHGLMSIAWDVKWRGSLRAAAVESVQKNWRQSLRQAYLKLRAESEEVLELPFLTKEEEVLSWTVLDLLVVVELDLVADLTSVLTFAGVNRIAARRVGPEDFALASKTVRKWAGTDEAVEAARLAADYLRRRITPDVLNLGWTPARGLYGPWSIYISSLVVWSFASPLPLLSDFPSSWTPADLRPFLLQVSTLLEDQRWGIGQEAGAILASLMERRL